MYFKRRLSEEFENTATTGTKTRICNQTDNIIECYRLIEERLDCEVIYASSFTTTEYTHINVIVACGPVSLVYSKKIHICNSELTSYYFESNILRLLEADMSAIDVD